MLTRVLIAAALALSVAGGIAFGPFGVQRAFASPQEAGVPKVLSLGLATHAVTEAELATDAPKRPRFNTPAIAYAVVANLKKGDLLRIGFVGGKQIVEFNQKTFKADQPKVLLMAGKTSVPPGGWYKEPYYALVEVLRGGKIVLKQSSKPMIFH